MSLSDYLPLLDGWEFDIWLLDEAMTVVKNRIDLVHRFEEEEGWGWLLSLGGACDDCFVNPYIHYPTIPPTSLMPYAVHTLFGETHWQAQAPYVPMYYRPNPASTAGWYIFEYQPAYPMPYQEWAEMLVELDPASTQTTATLLNLSVARWVIKDRDKFRRSLKEVLGVDDIAEAIKKVG